MIIFPHPGPVAGDPGGDTILLTGIPRSGTSLACRLLNQIPGTVALNEPLTALPAGDTPAARADALLASCQRLRATILAEQRFWTHQRDGVVTDAMFAAGPDASGRRPRAATLGWVTPTRPLPPDFTLVIKHTSLFMPLLPALTDRMPVSGMIRNPLPVLASWRSVDATLAWGEPGAAGELDSELRRDLAATPDVLDRQLRLLDWFFGQITDYLPPAAILRYEDLVASGGRALAAITPGAALLAEPLASRDRTLPLAPAEVAPVAARLLASEGAYWRLYARESVAALATAAG